MKSNQFKFKYLATTALFLVLILISSFLWLSATDSKRVENATNVILKNKQTISNVAKNKSTKKFLTSEKRKVTNVSDSQGTFKNRTYYVGQVNQKYDLSIYVSNRNHILNIYRKPHVTRLEIVPSD